MDLLGVLLTLILIVVIIGAFVWIVNSFTPIDAQFKRLLVGLSVLIVVLWVILALLGRAPVLHLT